MNQYLKAVRKQDNNVGVVYRAAWNAGDSSLYFIACETDGLAVTTSQCPRDALEVETP